MRIAALFIVATLAAAPANGQDGVSRLTVVVTGADPDVGLVSAGLFADAAGYDASMASQGGSDPYRSADAAVGADGRATLVFEGLSVGDYALTVHYDRDSDGTMNSGLFGMPGEKIGFSNDATARFGPPSWDDVRFDVGGDGAEIAVAVRRVGF